MDEITTRIITETKEVLAVCVTTLHERMNTETNIDEIHKLAQLLITVTNVCERVQGVERGGWSNPYLGTTL